MATHKTSKITLKIVALIILAITTCAIAFLALVELTKTNQEATEEPQTIQEPEPEPEEQIIEVELQEIVDTWLSEVGGKVGVEIYDIELDKIVAEANAHQKFNMASLYKLLVVYYGYEQIDASTWNGDAILYGNRSIYTCLDLAIRESNSPCAEALWSKIGQDNMNTVVSSWGFTETSVSGISSTPSDILKIMQKYYTHETLSEESWSKIQDSMLSQPVTTYDWRRGLPSGISEKTNVYNKVGWAYNTDHWDLYHDAAILEFPEYDRHYIVVVMSSYIDNKDIANLGTQIEAAIREANDQN